MNIALLKLNEEVTRLEANMVQTKLEIMFAKHAHALKELEAAQAGDTPAEEAKPTAAAKKQKAAAKKAAADVEKVQAAADKAVDMLWFVHGLAFNLINSPLFRDAVEKIKVAPAYKPCHRTTLSTSHLAARNADANEFKIKRL